MKVRITKAGLPVPVGTIMDVGNEAPRAWAGQYEVVIDEPKVEPEPEIEVDEPAPRAWRKPKPG